MSSPPSGGGEPDYEVLLVAYRSRALVAELLATLPRAVGVVVVDNSHDTDGLRAAAEARPGTRYVDGPGRGYAAGANLGMRYCRAPYVLLVNPDSSPRPEQLAALVTDLRDDERLAGVSAVTVRPDGRVEIGVGGWEPSLPRAVAHAVGLHVLLPSSGLWARPVPGRPIRLDWLSAACMAVRRSTFEQLGGLDESYFVYSEDVEFGRRVRESGHRLELRTDIVVPHVGGGSGEARTWMAQQRSASFVTYVGRYHSRPACIAIRAVLTAGMLARAAVRAARGDRVLATEHLHYVRGLLAGAPVAR